MNDLISRQAALNLLTKWADGYSYIEVETQSAINEFERLPSAQPEIISCKDCNKASKCYGDVLMKSRGGGYIYCPIEFCSEAERRTDE